MHTGINLATITLLASSLLMYPLFHYSIICLNGSSVRAAPLTTCVCHHIIITIYFMPPVGLLQELGSRLYRLPTRATPRPLRSSFQRIQRLCRSSSCTFRAAAGLSGLWPTVTGPCCCCCIWPTRRGFRLRARRAGLPFLWPACSSTGRGHLWVCSGPLVWRCYPCSRHVWRRARGSSRRIHATSSTIGGE